MTNTAPSRPLTHIPPDWATVRDYQREFCRQLPADIVATVMGNTAAHNSNSNQAALQNLRWQPTVLAENSPITDIRLSSPHAAKGRVTSR